MNDIIKNNTINHDNLYISLFNILFYVKAYANNIEYDLNDKVQIIIPAIKDLGFPSSLTDDSKDLAAKGELIIQDINNANRLFLFFSDFTDYEPTIDKNKYLRDFKSFSITLNDNTKTCYSFQVYFRNIYTDSGYIGINKMHVERYISYRGYINENMIIDFISSMIGVDNRIVKKKKDIEILVLKLKDSDELDTDFKCKYSSNKYSSNYDNYDSIVSANNDYKYYFRYAPHYNVINHGDTILYNKIEEFFSKYNSIHIIVTINDISNTKIYPLSEFVVMFKEKI